MADKKIKSLKNYKRDIIMLFIGGLAISFSYFVNPNLDIHEYAFDLYSDQGGELNNFLWEVYPDKVIISFDAYSENRINAFQLEYPPGLNLTKTKIYSFNKILASGRDYTIDERRGGVAIKFKTEPPRGPVEIILDGEIVPNGVFNFANSGPNDKVSSRKRAVFWEEQPRIIFYLKNKYKLIGMYNHRNSILKSIHYKDGERILAFYNKVYQHSSDQMKFIIDSYNYQREILKTASMWLGLTLIGGAIISILSKILSII
jgi:hypothetical protein